MTLRIRTSLLIVAAFAVLGFAQSVAHADPLVLSLQNSTLSEVPGGSVTFLASDFNNGATSSSTDTIFAMSISAPIALGLPDETGLVSNFLNQAVASGDTLGPLTNSVPDTVNPDVATATPEPTTMLLLGTGLLGIAAKLKRRRKEL